MPSTRNRATSVNVLRSTVEEDRRFHDELTSSFRSLRSKILYFIGAELAMLTFLYSGASNSNASIQERLFIPHELYGILFYFFGLLSMLYALVVLVDGARPNAQWTSPSIDADVLALTDKDEEEFWRLLHKYYNDAISDNLALHAKKNDAIKSAFIPLLMGAIILVVLKFFQ